MFSINPSACNSCGKCILKCPVDAIEFSADNKAMIDQTKCIQCGKCVSACPQNAIY
ncbi:MAG: 4Fe-4S binding protein [Candidatus Cloacimonetes bacterium]|nr:4Fe-4S binding protein [Candidatus Cloacimonadota bacterium]